MVALRGCDHCRFARRNEGDFYQFGNGWNDMMKKRKALKRHIREALICRAKFGVGYLSQNQ